MGKGQDQSKDEGYKVPEKRTETKEESLAPSLLSHIKDGQHKERDLEEAFCRDIDSFNLAFKVSLIVGIKSPFCHIGCRVPVHKNIKSK